MNNNYTLKNNTCQTEMGLMVYFVIYWMGPNVQYGKTRWDQTSSLAKMAWDQMSMGPIQGCQHHR